VQLCNCEHVFILRRIFTSAKNSNSQLTQKYFRLLVFSLQKPIESFFPLPAKIEPALVALAEQERQPQAD